MTAFRDKADMVLDEVAGVLRAVDAKQVDELIKEILKAKKVFFVGMGRTGHVLRCIAKRLFHIGIETNFVGELTEPPIEKGDLLIAASASGEKVVPVALSGVAKEKGARVAYIGAHLKSPLAGIADLSVLIDAPPGGARGPGGKSGQFAGSLFEQSLLIFGDTLALMIAEKRGIDSQRILKRHANLE
jgi:6-phospho-3-hexuloisomerase